MTDSTRKKPPIPLPHITKRDVYAIQALTLGEATKEQQVRALKWIVENACATYDFCNTPDNDRLSAIFDGRRFAGLQIVRATKINPTNFKE